MYATRGGQLPMRSNVATLTPIQRTILGSGPIPRNVMREDDTAGTEGTDMTVAASPVRQVHHHAYACWDSEETRHFYEDILGMPLIATVVTEDPLRNDGSRCCRTVFEIADGDTLEFFEHTWLAHPKYFNAKSDCHRRIAFEVEGDATVRQFKRNLDAAGVANILMN